jgi:plasmid stabilization system protein ParE
MRTYRFLTPAYIDLRDILDYLNTKSPAAASRFLYRLDQRLKLLSKFPNSGRTKIRPGT